VETGRDWGTDSAILTLLVKQLQQQEPDKIIKVLREISTVRFSFIAGFLTCITGELNVWQIKQTKRRGESRLTTTP